MVVDKEKRENFVAACAGICALGTIGTILLLVRSWSLGMNLAWFAPIAATISSTVLAYFLYERKKQERKSLCFRAVQLGSDLLHFLKNVGPEPILTTQQRSEMKGEEVLLYGMDYTNRIHHGYAGTLKIRTVNMFHELSGNGIQDLGFQIWDVDPPSPKLMRRAKIQEIAERLFHVAADMKIREVSK